MSEERYFQHGFGLKRSIQGTLRRDYHSALVDCMRDGGSRLTAGDLTLMLAREFGFCYGVDRAVEYAYETVEKFPDRRVFLTGEIIHNPRVNERMRQMSIRFFSSDGRPEEVPPDLDAADVVILPAFGVPAPFLETLRARGCILVDTTCGSVLNVWKNVEKFARAGFTSIIHGKFAHEETRATASRALMHPGGRYLIVRDMGQTERVCAYMTRSGEPAVDRAEFDGIFRESCSPGFDPDLHLDRIGVANQTTMLSSESLAIARRLREALVERYGDEGLEDRFRSFDTICSATQDRQDAVVKLIQEGIEVLLIIGGYNSSNTNHLATLGGRSVPTYHIDSAGCIQGPEAIRHQPIGRKQEIVTSAWLPPGKITVGITAGASTPNVMIGEVIERVLRCRGVSVESAGVPVPR